MKITFLNHACFLVEDKNTILLNDPYLKGAAFNDGWDLIIDDVKFEFSSNKQYFIYYSHEHPDHFSIPFINDISDDLKDNITIIYQETKDHRVSSFLRKKKFKVIEARNNQRINLNKNFDITIGKVPFYDSWALIDVNGKKILNANDCILEHPDRVRDIKKITEKIDILFTQYSYANWVEGGKNSKSARQELAAEKLRRIKMQADILRPSFIVPFASMVRFCHAENSYMNDSINTPRDTVEFIDNKTNATPYIMTPLEVWDGEMSKDNESALAFWDAAYINALKRPLISTNKKYSIEDLFSSNNKMIARVKTRNNYMFIKFLSIIKVIPNQVFKVTDLDLFVQFSWHKGLNLLKNEPRESFITISSDSIYFLFANDFGVDTLNVNARFSGSLKQKKNLIKTFFPLALNNTGRYMTFWGIITSLNSSFIKQGLKTVGILR
jgi:UDP-MurNAc hydroxylase